MKHGENLFEFAYDWRRDNRVASRQLPRRPRAGSRRGEAKSGNRDAKLILIGHSMGGLVARHFIECREGWRDAHPRHDRDAVWGSSTHSARLPTARR